jgi:hypothetical protein
MPEEFDSAGPFAADGARHRALKRRGKRIDQSAEHGRPSRRRRHQTGCHKRPNLV